MAIPLVQLVDVSHKMLPENVEKTLHLLSLAIKEEMSFAVWH